jgi:hypothetical protein
MGLAQLSSADRRTNDLLRLVQLVFIPTVVDGLAEMRVVINLRQGTGAFGSVDAAGRAGQATAPGSVAEAPPGQQLVKESDYLFP